MLLSAVDEGIGGEIDPPSCRGGEGPTCPPGDADGRDTFGLDAKREGHIRARSRIGEARTIRVLSRA